MGVPPRGFQGKGRGGGGGGGLVELVTISS